MNNLQKKKLKKCSGYIVHGTHKYCIYIYTCAGTTVTVCQNSGEYHLTFVVKIIFLSNI